LRFTIAIGRLSAAGDSRTAARCLAGVTAAVLRMEPVTVSDLQCSGVSRRHLLLHRISLHVSNPAISGCGLAL